MYYVNLYSLLLITQMFYFRESNVPIRPQKPFLKHNANQPPPNIFPNSKSTELQGRQPEKAHFGIFKQEGIPPQKGSTNCSTRKPISEERKQPENKSRYLLNLQQKSTSISFASELEKALPKKDDTQTNLFGMDPTSENILPLHNNAKSVLFGANDSRNDSLQKSIKAELDQSSSQLYDKVLERRIQLTQMEFEKEYSEVENSLHPKPLENKSSLISPTRFLLMFIKFFLNNFIHNIKLATLFCIFVET